MFKLFKKEAKKSECCNLIFEEVKEECTSDIVGVNEECSVKTSNDSCNAKSK
ncbi:hypothetical protein SAMN05216565_11575 [Litchfieldia salsa]|uniref:Uncharacterized protein n=1 Tax=Litchfieldia salsa TaxID=930152 RepID=A0A1H0WTD2_9BACI|nr:hypothetical protein SAMN05216565_11575 [Litchfieldia salsa]